MRPDNRTGKFKGTTAPQCPHKKQTCVNSTVEFMKPSGSVLRLVLSVGPVIYLEAKQQTRTLNPSSARGEVALLRPLPDVINGSRGSGLPLSCAPRADTAAASEGSGAGVRRSTPIPRQFPTYDPNTPLPTGEHPGNSTSVSHPIVEPASLWNLNSRMTSKPP